MQAVTFHAPGDVRVEAVSEPRLEASTDALVRVERTAICGSDLHVYRGVERGLDPGTVLGHEFVGRIEALGDAVAGLAPGDRVVSPFSTSCGACPECARGLPSRCRRGELFGWVQDGRGLPGAQAARVRVPLAGTTLVRVPAGLAPELALLAGDVLATGWHALDLAAPAPDGELVVLGAGAVGLCALAAARARGLPAPLAVDGRAARRALAERLGARACAPDEACAAVRERTAGAGADAVVEAVGSPAASRLALDLARPGGTIAAVGVHAEATFAFAPGELYDKNLTYRAGRAPARRYLEPLLRRLAEDDLGLAAILSHRVPLAEAAAAYRLFEAGSAGCTKVLLLPD